MFKNWHIFLINWYKNCFCVKKYIYFSILNFNIAKSMVRDYKVISFCITMISKKIIRKRSDSDWEVWSHWDILYYYIVEKRRARQGDDYRQLWCCSCIWCCGCWCCCTMGPDNDMKTFSQNSIWEDFERNGETKEVFNKTQTYPKSI